MHQKSVNDSSRLGKTSRHIRGIVSSPLGLLLLSVIAIIVTLPSISCYEIVNRAQYTRQAFHDIGCHGTYEEMSLKMLSQACYQHSEGYDDSRYKECRKDCFTTNTFRSVAAMIHYVQYHELKADAWLQFRDRIQTLSGTTVHA